MVIGEESGVWTGSYNSQNDFQGGIDLTWLSMTHNSQDMACAAPAARTADVQGHTEFSLLLRRGRNEDTFLTIQQGPKKASRRKTVDSRMERANLADLSLQVPLQERGGRFCAMLSALRSRL